MFARFGLGPTGACARTGGSQMHRALRTLASATHVAAFAALGAAASWAMSPDDAIYLTQQGTTDDVIIAKICGDGEAWDLTSDDISYLKDHHVSDEVIQALIDPAAAADRYGYRLGDGRTDDQPEATPYVYSTGYYYGPISRCYFYDPYYYPYYYSPGFSFSIGFGWPGFYASYYYPYCYGYYAYPYYSCAPYSSYYGYNYCGAGYSTYYARYRYGSPYYGAGNVSYHGWNSTTGARLNTGGSLEQRSRSGEGIAQVGRGSSSSARAARSGDLSRGVSRTTD